MAAGTSAGGDSMEQGVFNYWQWVWIVIQLSFEKKIKWLLMEMYEWELKMHKQTHRRDWDASNSFNSTGLTKEWD